MTWVVYAALIFLVYKMVTKAGGKVIGEAPKAARRKGPSPYAVLGVDPDASPDEIKRAYQDKIRQYHPDRVAGAAPEIQQLAEKRSKELNAAYQQLIAK